MSNPIKCIDADAYLFDIDGTLLHAYGGAHYNAFHSAIRKEFGLQCKIDGVPLHGSTDTLILRAVLRREGITDTEIDARLSAMIDEMCTEVERNSALVRSETCPAIPELIQYLHRKGKLLGVASGNLERIGWIKISATGLRPYFSFGAFNDRHDTREEIFYAGIAEARRLLHSGARVCVIGDTPADILAAKANNVPVIAAATGIFSFEELMEQSPDLCVTSCAEFLPLL